MSGVAALRSRLAGNAALIAVVPAARIFSGVIPLKTTLPAIGLTQISGVEEPTVAMRQLGKQLRTDRVQVTIEAASYPSQKQILELVRAACGHFTGAVNGVDLLSIRPAGQGPDFYDADTQIYTQSCDFMVAWRTP